VTDLQVSAIRIARSFLGKRELGPLANRGPDVDAWLAFCGIRPEPTEAGKAWCACFASWCVARAAAEIGVTPLFRRSAGALRLLEVNQELRVAGPDPGCLVVWQHEGGKGHVGIITGVTRVGGELASIDVIAGNTSADGASRDADSVAERGFPFPQARTVAGYLEIR
jgi:hypothetical protein